MYQTPKTEVNQTIILSYICNKKYQGQGLFCACAEFITVATKTIIFMEPQPCANMHINIFIFVIFYQYTLRSFNGF